MNKDDLIRRGLAADQTLRNEHVMSALQEIEAECLASWSGSNPNDQAGREDAYRMTRSVRLLRDKLMAWRDAGTFETTTIAQADKARQMRQPGETT